MDFGLGKRFTKRGLKSCPACKNLNAARSTQCTKCKRKLECKNKDNNKSMKTQRVTSSLSSFAIEDVPVQIENEPSEINIVNFEDYQDFELTDCQIELMDEFNQTDKIDIPEEYLKTEEFDFIEEHFLEFEEALEFSSEDKLTKTDDKKIQVINKFLVRKLLKNQKTDLNLNTFIKLLASNGILLNKAKIKNNIPVYSPEKICMDFNHWLNSVIERIHLEMDFNGNEVAKSISLTVAHNFFKCLSARFSITNRKRVPNKIIPLSSGLTKSIWIFNSFNLVKQIFQSEKMRIETEQKFIKIRDNPPTFEKFVLTENIPETDTQDQGKHSSFRKISPKLYSTRIKVNPKSTGIEEHTLTISWIPNVLKQTQHGELEIKFHYERKDQFGQKLV